MKQDPIKARPDRWLFGFFLLLLAWLPLPWGSNTAWAVPIAGIAVFLLLAWWSLLLVAGRVTWPLRLGRFALPLLLWALWLTWIAAQAVPLPPDVLAAITPSSFAVHQQIAQLESTAPVYSISIAPGQTWAKWYLNLVYFGIYLLTVLTLRTDSRLRWLLLVLFVSGLFQAAYGGLMTLSGIEYGFFEKKIYYLGAATGTFVNRNHLAGYLEMTAAIGMGLVLADLRGGGRWGWRALVDGLLNLMLSTKLRVRLALVVIAIGLVLTRSRMGNLAFFSSVSLCGLAYVVLRERQVFFRALLLFASILLVDVLIINQWFGLERVIERIDATRIEKEGRAQLLQEIGPVVAAYRLTGAGLGSFAYAYEPYRSPAMHEYMNHAHNDYVEFVVEVGIPGFCILIALVGVHLLHASRVILRRRHRLKVAACFSVITASVALAIHATADFNFQIPANAATYVVLLAIAASCSSRSRNKRRRAHVDQTAQSAEGQTA